MTNEPNKIKNGSITSPKGFQACGVRCGLKEDGLDMALVMSDVTANVAAMFTTNRIQAAPVILSKERVKTGRARALVVNSGNANACTGEQGFIDAEEMTSLAAQYLNIQADQVLLASTGVIGETLPMELVRRGIQVACENLSTTGGIDAAKAIMTTDTKPKHFSITFEIEGKTCTIGGIAKGSGMINPKLATMISVLTTDVNMAADLLQNALPEAIDVSFNALTIDGEMSTNDTVFLFANGMSGNELVTSRGEAYDQFVSALKAISLALSKELAADGEGATKLVTVRVENASSQADAYRAAKAIGNSLLVKTAIYGQDPNWGRVVSALGASGAELDPAALAVRFADIPVMKYGTAIQFDVHTVQKALSKKEVSINVSLGVGHHSGEILTCDLTHDYITINAEYHT